MSRLTSWALAAAMLFAADASAAVLARQSGAFGIVTYDLPPASGYEAWAAANGIEGAWNETDALGIHNVFRYAFDDTNAVPDPPFLSIAFDADGRPLVLTPPLVNDDDFDLSLLATEDAAGTSNAVGYALDPSGTNAIPGEIAPARFFRLKAAEDLGGVQLWENGPYWAECNVGAATPEEYGYYFWWGDTMGYARSDGTWTNNFIHPGFYSGVTWVSSTGEQMSNSPFTTSCPTYHKENSELLDAGYIDSTGNLVAAHDAATMHLGAPWRMPTSAEINALASNCTNIWITTNGVSGRLVTGKGAYANRSIFLPAAGYGSGSSLYDPGSYGEFWASTPIPDFSYNAWDLYISSSYFEGRNSSRNRGQSVRPVRDAD